MTEHYLLVGTDPALPSPMWVGPPEGACDGGGVCAASVPRFHGSGVFLHPSGMCSLHHAAQEWPCNRKRGGVLFLDGLWNVCMFLTGLFYDAAASSLDFLVLFSARSCPRLFLCSNVPNPC